MVETALLREDHSLVALRLLTTQLVEHGDATAPRAAVLVLDPGVRPQRHAIAGSQRRHIDWKLS
jgi:hypothetical protein